MPYFVPTYEVWLNNGVIAAQLLLSALLAIYIIRSIPNWNRRLKTPFERIGLILTLTSISVLFGVLTYLCIAGGPLLHAKQEYRTKYDPTIKAPNPGEGIRVVDEIRGWSLYDSKCLIEKDWTPNNSVYPIPKSCLLETISNQMPYIHTSWKSFLTDYQYTQKKPIWLGSLLVLTLGALMSLGAFDKLIRWIKKGTV